MAITPRSFDWAPVRKAFVERNERPTYDELSGEFQIPIATLHRASSEEGWAALRAQYLEQQLAKADASGVLLKAIRIDQSLVTQASSVAITLLEKLQETLVSIDGKTAASSRASVLNTCSFAFKNVTDGLKSAGLLGISKTLDAEGRGSGQWNPKLLTQINVVVDGLKTASGPAQAHAGSSEPVDVQAESASVS